MESQNDAMEKVTTRSAGMKYGLFMGVISIVSFLVATLSGINITDGVGAWVNRLVSLAAALTLLYMAQEAFKKNGDGFMSYGQGLGIGFWQSATASLLSSVFMYIYVKFVDDAFIRMIVDKQREAMEQKGMSDEQMEQAMKIASMFTTPEAILIFGILGGIFFGVIIALLLTIFTQKSNPDTSI